MCVSVFALHNVVVGIFPWLIIYFFYQSSTRQQADQCKEHCQSQFACLYFNNRLCYRFKHRFIRRLDGQHAAVCPHFDLEEVLNQLGASSFARQSLFKSFLYLNLAQLRNWGIDIGLTVLLNFFWFKVWPSLSPISPCQRRCHTLQHKAKLFDQKRMMRTNHFDAVGLCSCSRSDIKLLTKRVTWSRKFW